MLTRKLLLLLAAPVILSLLVVLSKKDVLSPAMHIELNIGSLDKTRALWEDRTFHEIHEDDLIRSALYSSLLNSVLSENERLLALDSCFRMIKAFGTADWEMFEKVRIPVDSYKITPHAQRILAPGGSPVDRRHMLGLYKEWWLESFTESSLFNRVSIPAASIEVSEIAPDGIGLIQLPYYNRESPGAQWGSVAPPAALDFSEMFSQRKLKVMSLYFFAKSVPFGEGSRPYLITFVWLEGPKVWLPHRLIFGMIKKPLHEIKVF